MTIVSLVSALITMILVPILPIEFVKNFFGCFLGLMGGVYIGAVLTQGHDNLNVILEVVSGTITLLLGVLALYLNCTTMICCGMILHGIWDWSHDLFSNVLKTKIPHWYIPFCMWYDIIIGVYLYYML